MKIRITRTIKLHQNILKKVVAELLPINGPMIFNEEKTPLMFQVDEFEWDSFLVSVQNTDYQINLMRMTS